MRHSSQAQGTATARRYRLLRWIAFSVLSLVALAVIAAVAGPALLDLPAVQARLEQKLSEAAHGQLERDELEVHLLPAPHGVMRKAHIHIPDVVDGTVEELEVALRLVPLFAGRVELQELLIVRPVVKVKVPASGESASTEPLDPIAAYRRALGPVVPVLQRFASDLTVKVQEPSNAGQLVDWAEWLSGWASGGDYSVANGVPTDLAAHYPFPGDMFRQTKDLPEGTRVKVVVLR